ncbi:MAG: DUF5412 family protein [Bacillota bacterium]
MLQPIFVCFVLSGFVFIDKFKKMQILKMSVSIPTYRDDNYTIEFFLTNGGSTTSFGVLGKLDGPLGFEKKIYDEYPMDHVDVEWINEHTVLINNHVLNLKKGDTYSD